MLLKGAHTGLPSLYLCDSCCHTGAFKPSLSSASGRRHPPVGGASFSDSRS